MATKPPSGVVRHAAMEILNCGTSVTKEDVSRALNAAGIASWVRIAKGHNEPTCRVTFNSIDERRLAMSLITQAPVTTDELQGPWRVKNVYMARPRITKDKEDAINAKPVIDAVAPWGSLPYEEQLAKKYTLIKDSTEKWCSSLSLRDYTVKDIVASPQTREYRNKLDFTIGIDASGRPCAGFRVGSYKEGGKSAFRVEAGEACLVTSPEIGLKVAEHVDKFMREKSSLPVYDQEQHVGFWRGLSVRWSHATKDLMVILRCAKNCEGAGEEMERVVFDLRENFAFQGVKIASLYWQWWDGISFQAAPETDLIHVYGKEYIDEQLMGMHFRVSPAAFFQVNTYGAEKLFGVVQSLLTKHQGNESQTTQTRTLLLDVCCGTGVIGIACSKHADIVAGIELSAQAIDNARANAALNGVDNKCFFICSKAESVLSRLLTGEAKPMMSKSDTVLTEKDESSLLKAIEMSKGCSDVVAIVDPPRAGLHPSVVKALLRCAAVSRIIYVSCNPLGSFVDNAKTFCGRGPVISHQKDVRYLENILPFKPTTLVPVDMFPHTEHVELVAEFVRDKDAILEKPSETAKQPSKKARKCT